MFLIFSHVEMSSEVLVRIRDFIQDMGGNVRLANILQSALELRAGNVVDEIINSKPPSSIITHDVTLILKF